MNDWHLVHLGSFARGGAGLVFTEATAVQDIGTLFRIVVVLTMDKLVPSYTFDVIWEILSLIANSFLIIICSFLLDRRSLYPYRKNYSV